MNLPRRIKDWPDEAIADWNERAGIMEFDGGLARREAERQAEKIVRRQYAAVRSPQHRRL